MHTPRERLAAWAVHLLTASGVIVGLVGLNSVIDGHARAAILWLVVAMLVDGLDGPIARALDVKGKLPHCDGNALDLMVDYFTCVVVPVAFLDKFNVLPDNTIGITGVIILFTSVLWMARADIETGDGWFRGFPAEWNLIIPSLYLLHVSPWFNLVVCLIFAGLCVSRVEFPHPVQVRERRAVSLAFLLAWVVAMVGMAAILPDRDNAVLRFIIVTAPMWMIFQVLERAWTNRQLAGADGAERSKRSDRSDRSDRDDSVPGDS